MGTLIILLVIQVYLVYFLIRNNAVFKIRSKWIDSGDSRWDKYKYGEMLNPKISNWFGLRYPKDSHFK